MTERDVFLAAIDVPDRVARATYLDGACAGDPALRSKVEALLQSHEAAGSFLHTPAVAAPDPGNDPTLTCDGGHSPESEEALTFLAPPQRQESLGRIGHYEVLEILGKGGFGIVFRAFDDVLQRVVAVKVMAPQLAATSPARKRFLREARTSAAVRHENVVQVYEVAESPLPYLAMEFIPGETLQQKLNRTGPLDVPEVLRIGRQISEGLAAAHANDVIHRDIKPANVLIEGGPQEKVKITDFGLARAADDASISQSGIIAGTPMYMAPEQALGHKLDQRADLFSLGSVLYQMVAGRAPFRATGTVAVLKRVAEDTPRDIREIIPETPQWLCNIIAKLHEKNPDDRYQSAREIADVLADCEQQLKAHGSLKDYSRIPGGNPQRRRIGRKWKRAAAAVVLLLAVAVGADVLPFALRYAFDAGKVTFTNDYTEDKLLVRRDGQVVATLDSANSSAHLASGEYELEAVCARCAEGEEVSSVIAGTRRLFEAAPGRGADGPVLKLSIRRGDRIRVGFGVKDKVPPPSLPDGWVRLFNGKDLTGWKETRQGPTGWKVERNVLKAAPGQTLLPSILSTERTDFRDFHLLMELRTNSSTRASIDVRSDGLVQTAGYGVWLMDVEGKAPIFSLTRQGSTAQKAKPVNVKPEEWYQLEITAYDNVFQVQVDNQLVAQWTDDNPVRTSGPITIFQMVQTGMLEFRKIEIKEFPPSSPQVPKRAADVLPFLAGNWKVERQNLEPKLPPDKSSDTGFLTYDYVAGGRFLRGRGSFGEGTDGAFFLHTFNPGNNELRHWQAWVKQNADGPAAGLFNPDNHTLTWKHNVSNGIESIHQLNFIDPNTIRTRLFQQDASNTIIRELRLTMTRVKNQLTMPIMPVDPNRPAEMKVLDRLAGEWSNQQTVTTSATPDKPKFESSRTKAELVLGGRFVEQITTGETNQSNDYSLVWFEAPAKQYRRWYFSGIGTVTELTGTWDAAAKTMTLSSPDNAVVAREVFKSDDLSEFQLTFKNRGGMTVMSTTGVSRRLPSNTLPPTFKNGIGMEFVKVPKGKSWLGGGSGTVGHLEVEIPADFYLGKHEVTQEEWEKVMGENPSHFSRTGGGKDAVKDIPDADLKRFPIENVSWDQCQLFVEQLNSLEKKSGWVYRLPTLTEWEYACRGGPMVDQRDSAFDFYFARPTNTLLPEQANVNNVLKRPCKVGSYEPNVLGLHDVHGNVWEWCDDEVGAEFGKASSRAVAGGCQDSGIEHYRAAFRGAAGAFLRNNYRGFRLARIPSGAPSPEAKSPPTVVVPFTDADVRRIAALPAATQIREVKKELMRLNPGFDGAVEHKIEKGVVTELHIVTDRVTNIAPIRVFKALRTLALHGTTTDRGQLADLTPLTGMNLASLTRLSLNFTRVSDAGLACFNDCKNLVSLGLQSTRVGDPGLAYFKDCKKLTHLNLINVQISDAGLAHFKDCKDLTRITVGGTKLSDTGLAQFKDWKALTHLTLDHTQVSDAGLAHLKGMKLNTLRIDNTGITDLSPLQGMPLEDVLLTPKNISRGLEILRDMKSLKSIGIGYTQAWPAAEFWARYDKGEFAAIPFTDADAKRIAALPAAEQIEEVGKELVKRNPDFDGKVNYKIEGGVVTELVFVTDKVRDIAPIRVFNGLQVLDLSGTEVEGEINGQLADLAPLKGMNLASLTKLSLNNTKIDDAGLVHFKDCKNLTHLWLNNAQVTSSGMACFKDCKKLTHLGLKYTQVDDAGLVHFKDCRDLTGLDLGGLAVTERGLANFKDCDGLSELWLNGRHLDDNGLAQFKGCKNLTMLHIGGSQVTDEGLGRLKEYQKLKTVWLDGTQITDAGLDHLVGLDELTKLILVNTKVTAKSVEDLAKALPKCMIKWDGGTIGPK